MFNSYEFTYAGESSFSYGLMIYDFGGKGQSEVSFGNKASLFELRTNNRIQPIHFGVNYHKTPLEFKLVFGAEDPLDRYDLERISSWLTGNQTYEWLTIDQPDLNHVRFRCLITSLTPLTHGWLPVAFEATILCDCPYAYGFEFEEDFVMSDSTTVLFRNDSSVKEYLKPTLYIDMSHGASELTIVNRSDNDREFKMTGLPSGIQIVVDNNNGIIYTVGSDYNLYDGFNMNFFRLVPGDNELEITGHGTLTIKGSFLHNVAG